MKLSSSFEIVDVAKENIAVPVGALASTFKGVVVLNEATAFLLNNMKQNKSKEDLILLLCGEYDVSEDVAERDILKLFEELQTIGVVKE